MKNLYTERAEQAQEAIDRLRAEMELVTNNSSSRLRWTQHFKEFSAMTALDRRAVIALETQRQIMEAVYCLVPGY